MANAYETDRYEDAPNFNHRFKVETAYPDGKRDHRDGFTQQEYQRNQQDKPEEKEPMAGFPPMKGTTEAPKPKGGVKKVSRSKTKTDDVALEAAKTKDLKNRNLK